MSGLTVVVEGTGDVRRVEASVDVPPPDGSHVWLAMVGFRLEDAELREIVAKGGKLSVTLGSENLAFGPLVGCYHCEQAFSPERLDTTCPGDPRGEWA